MNNFSEVLNAYVEGCKKAEKPPVEEMVIKIDHRPNAVVGDMLLTKPKDEDQADEYIAALIAGIAEIVASETGDSAYMVGIYLAEGFGEMIECLKGGNF